jgi:hypothetical protein
MSSIILTEKSIGPSAKTYVLIIIKHKKAKKSKNKFSHILPALKINAAKV